MKAQSWIEFLFSQQPDMETRLKAVREFIALKKRIRTIVGGKQRG
jgi:hypothetical protein